MIALLFRGVKEFVSFSLQNPIYVRGLKNARLGALSTPVVIWKSLRTL
jgi:hypothetical protein